MWIRKNGVIQRDEGGKPLPRTSHSLNEVPFIVFDPRGEIEVREGEQGLAAIATTLLELCGLQAPEGYVPGLVR